jgi:hypothetical protein
MLKSYTSMLRRLIFLSFLAPVACYYSSERVPLPVPFLPTTGATPVPGNGFGFGYDLGRSVIGPELASAQTAGVSAGIGLDDRLSVWYGSARSRGGTSRTFTAGVRQVRGKFLVAKPFGWRSALAVYGARAWGERRAQTYVSVPMAPTVQVLQRDQVFSSELAVPVEFLLGRRFAQTRPSIYFGPRLTHVRYLDQVRADGNFTTVIPGILGGLHLSGPAEAFLEGTLAYVPRRQYAGSAGGGYVALMPSLGFSVRLGAPYLWRASRN